MRINAGHLACLLNNHHQINPSDIITSITATDKGINVKGESFDGQSVKKLEIDLNISEAEALEICAPVTVEHDGLKTKLI